MRKTFSKFLATAAAVSMLASVSAVVNADEAASIEFATKAVEGGVVITGVTGADEATEIEIPEMIGEATVVGVDDYAFAELNNVTTFVCPATLKADFMGNVAFMTKASIADYITSKIGEDADETKFITYVCEQLEFLGKTEGWTAEEIADAKARIQNKANLAGVAEDAAKEDAIVTMLKNKPAMKLSEDTANKLGIWEATVTYSNITVVSDAETEIAAYAAAREALGMAWKLDLLPGDANADGEITVRDCAAIANAMAYKTVDELPGDGDFNQDGEVTVRDAAAIASALVKGEIAK